MLSVLFYFHTKVPQNNCAIIFLIAHLFIYDSILTDGVPDCAYISKAEHARPATIDLHITKSRSAHSKQYVAKWRQI